MMLISSKSELTSMIGLLRGVNFLAFDIETTGFDPYSEKMVMLQFWDGEEDHPVYIVDARNACASKKKAEFLGEMLAPVFEEAGVIVGHNLKFDLSWSRLQLGLELPRLNIWDTMIAEQYVKGLGSSDAMKQNISFSLKATAHRYNLGEMSKEERSWFIGLNSRGDEWGADFPPEQLAYAEKDVRVLKPIWEAQRRTLEARGMLPAMSDEMGALIALVECELNGIYINVPAWRAFIKEKEEEAEGYYEQVYGTFAPAILSARAQKFEEEMNTYRLWESYRESALGLLRGRWEMGGAEDHGEPWPKWGEYKTLGMKAWREAHPKPNKPKISNEPANLGSPTQLLEALHAKGIQVKSAGVEVLEPLKEQHKEIALLLQWRKSVKFSQSFGESLLSKINPHTGRIHPTFHQVGASSGRMSSSNPNFQQIPSKGDGARIRGCVVAPAGYKLLVADYSAQELRILADQSGDENMLALFERKADAHIYTASLMFGIPEEEVTKEQRGIAKTINYLICYGGSAFLLSSRLKVSTGEAEDLMSKWFEAYPKVKPWLEERAKYTQKTLTSPTVTGWVRRFPHPPSEPTRPKRYSDGGYDDGAWEKYHEGIRERKAVYNRLARQGMNTPIQGAAAGITKKALALFVRGFDSKTGRCYNSGSEYTKWCENSKLHNFRLIAVVHDEIVVEAREEDAEAAAEYLADCMDAACKAVLKRVFIPRTEVVISDHWTH